MIEELGSGGMATVYRARDRELRRDVAIKVLFSHLCKNREIVARFQREARAAAGLDHPHILRVFDVGGGGADSGSGSSPAGSRSAGGARGGDEVPAREREPADPPFIVLELVRGPSLAGIIEGGALIAELAAACGAAIAAALAHAHKAGVIHRDIKPANLLVAEGGRLVLADFGVARVAEDDSSLVTRTGALLGTPAFMSPEQATGAPLDARSDLYSLGATLYQLATGSLPVSGNAARAVSAIVSGEIVPPLRRNPAMGRDLARLIERLMAVDPAARVASAAELETELCAIALPIGEPDALLGELFTDRAACEARVVPLAVASSVARARRAADEGNPARALALCDRALALDAGCREAEEIARSIGARRMWRRVAAVLAAVVLLAGGAVGAWMMWSSEEEEGRRPVAAATPLDLVDASPPAAPIEVADAAPRAEKPETGDRQEATGDGQRKKRPPVAGATPRAPVAVDAAPVVDQTAPEKPPAPAREADATLTLEMDTWCDLAIDKGTPARLTRRKTLTLRPGRHALACTNSGLGRTWSETVELAPGDKKTLAGSLLPTVAVAVRVTGGDAVRIAGQRAPAGRTASVKRGHVQVEILRGGKVLDVGYIDLVKPCTLVDRPAIACR